VFRTLLHLSTVVSALLPALAAPVPDLHFERFGLADGLSQGTIRCIAQDRQGFLWFGTQDGLNRYDGHNFHTFRYSPADAGSVPNNSIAALLVDRQGTLWVATTGGGVATFSPATQRFTRHPLSDPNASALFEAPDGTLWAGSQFGGLHRWNGQSFVAYPLPGVDTMAIQAGPGSQLLLTTRYSGGLAFTPSTGVAAPADVPMAWLADPSGGAWQATATGLLRREPDGTALTYQHDRIDPRSLSSNDIRSILIDRSGTFWAGTRNGLNRLSPVSRRFGTFRRAGVRSFYEAPNGELWVGTDNELEHQDPKSGEFTTVAPGLVVYALQPGAGNTLWLGTAAGLVEFSPPSQRRAPLLPSEVIYQIAVTPRELWLGARGGLYHVELPSRRITHYRHDPADPASLAGNDIRALVLNPDGTLWLGTRQFGLDHFNPQTKQFTHHRHDAANPETLSGDAIYTLLRTPSGDLWVGTTAGLSYFQTATRTATRYSTLNGLPNDTINAVLPGLPGQIWVATNLGLSCFDPATRSFRNFTVNHGLQANEFNGAAALLAPASGYLYFGGISGFNRFRPAALSERTFQPPVVLTGFYKLGVSVADFNPAQPVRLSWRDPMISFEYAALDFAAPLQLRYAYLLEGFDADWRETNRRLATYTNLDPGTYTFRVRATNADGAWGPHQATVVVTIVPPPWQTWWFRSLVAAALAAAVFLLYRARVRRFVQAQAAQEAFSRLLLASQEAERKKIAAELHDSLGQNLIVIRNHALLGLAQPHLPTLPRLQEIADSASLAIDEVREIATNLRPQQLERLGLTSALRAIVNRAAAASPIRFNTNLAPIDGLVAKDDEIHLYRIVQEAINNILKHSHATEASLTLTPSPTSLRLEIRDNGRGFDAHAQSHTAGLGLSSLAERARILHARFTLRTAPQQGTVILLEMEVSHGPTPD